MPIIWGLVSCCKEGGSSGYAFVVSHNSLVKIVGILKMHSRKRFKRLRKTKAIICAMGTMLGC